jgi:hypothetical protein
MSISEKSRSGSMRSRRYRLNTYLATGLGACGLASSAEAAVVSINITSPNISGVNAGVASGAKTVITSWPIAGAGTLEIHNAYVNDDETLWGFDGESNGAGRLDFAYSGVYADPRNFSAGSLIDSSANWTSRGNDTAFRYISGPNDFKAPVFGTNSFMGFRFSTNRNVDVYYGWLEVTWNGTDTFQILAAAYEDTPNTAIAAGSTGGGAVPEPASSAIVALLMGGTALRQWRKKRCENDTANNSVAL